MSWSDDFGMFIVGYYLLRLKLVCYLWQYKFNIETFCMWVIELLLIKWVSVYYLNRLENCTLSLTLQSEL